MKKLLSILMVGSLVLMLTACDPATNGSDSSSSDSSVSDSASDSSDTGADLDVGDETIGKQTAKIVSVEKTKDTAGNDAVIVTINWKNGGDKAVSFGSAIAVKATQTVEGEAKKLASTTTDDSAAIIAETLKDVAPGSAIQVKEVLALVDGSDVTIELTEAFGAVEGEVITATLPLA